jgi:hypothetical protein
VRGEAERADLLDDGVEVGLGGVGLHGDEHDDSSAARAGVAGLFGARRGVRRRRR